MERNELSRADRMALANAVEKLEALGARLPYPHQSQVKNSDRLRELRPRGGRSQVRAFYRQISEWMVIGSVGPEAIVDGQGFWQAVRQAVERLNKFEED